MHRQQELHVHLHIAKSASPLHASLLLEHQQHSLTHWIEVNCCTPIQQICRYDAQVFSVTGRISYKVTGTPCRAICQAASLPASPAPMTVTLCVFRQGITLLITFTIIVIILNLFLMITLRASEARHHYGSSSLPL